MSGSRALSLLAGSVAALDTVAIVALQHLQETTAFKGTASSPACTKLPRGGKFTLFGPASGE